MALGFGATLVTADGRNDGGAGLRGQLKGAPGILGRRAQGEAGRNRGRDRGRAVVRAGKEDLTAGPGWALRGEGEGGSGLGRFVGLGWVWLGCYGFEFLVFLF